MRTKATEASAVWEAQRDGVSVEQIWQRRAEMYPARRILDTSEVAEMIAFLASDASSGVNGESITSTVTLHPGDQVRIGTTTLTVTGP